ncbi:nitrate- and nitrite sensing domain-containing protein [Cesiribacter andamanensis]|uniref:Nitrate and nitrite sensing n=1 Tax=Cesiribacter andamanensis AMV16 TaxID=1279009 RepID=M7N3M2_9BACT|nr:nitrate- and nitrite sensing domain-containing protein [Cesiribacter andamanensis]EMR01801.1 Nitrate and nitrite sensing [Cesiribacter andamanensis AMV16]
MKLIRNLRIRDKLLLLLLLLLIPLIYFVTTTVQRELRATAELNEVAAQLRESAAISAYVHEFQKERARLMAAEQDSAAYYREALQQRERTDVAEQQLQQELDDANHQFADLALAQGLRQYRRDSDKGQLNVEDFRIYSADLLNRFLYKIDENATGISNVTLSRDLIGFTNLVKTKIQLARIRSQMARTIEVGQFSIGEYGAFTAQKELYYTYLNDFKRYATMQELAAARELTNTQDYQTLAAFLYCWNATQCKTSPAMIPGKYLNCSQKA